MLHILEFLEKKLKLLKVTSSECDKVISKSPANLKVFRSSSTLELTAVLASITETVLHERISVVMCDSSSMYNQDRAMFHYLCTTLAELPKLCNVAVVFACCMLAEMPSVRFPRPADKYWSINKLPNCHGRFSLTVKHQLKRPHTVSTEKEYSMQL